jgi:D-alanine transaminase
MADVLWFNGRFTTTDEPVLTVEDRGLLFGDAVYEVLKFVGRAPILASAHWARLCRCLELLEIRNPWSAGEFSALLAGLLDRTGFDDGIVYMQVSRGCATRSHGWPEGMTPSAFAYTSRFRFPDETMRRGGVGVVTTTESRWARCEIKSVNLLPNAISRTAARRAGAWEAVYVDDGRVIEGSSSNVFVVIDGELVTHEKSPGLLPGTVRDAVIGLAREAGLVVHERAPLLADLDRASEVFLTSTTSSVLPVASVDGRCVGNGTRGPVTERLQQAFGALEVKEADDWRSGLRL